MVVYFDAAVPETDRAMENYRLASEASYTYKRVIVPGLVMGKGAVISADGRHTTVGTGP